MNLYKWLLIILITFPVTIKGSAQVSPNGQAVIDVEYKAIDSSGIKWKQELELTRIIPTLNGKGIRITLPNSDTAKVLILDDQGNKKLKPILYVAPAMINVSKLKKGSYQLILEMHNVVVLKTFQKSK